jgi:hypothetical protein
MTAGSGYWLPHIDLMRPQVVGTTAAGGHPGTGIAPSSPSGCVMAGESSASEDSGASGFSRSPARLLYLQNLSSFGH